MKKTTRLPEPWILPRMMVELFVKVSRDPRRCCYAVWRRSHLQVQWLHHIPLNVITRIVGGRGRGIERMCKNINILPLVDGKAGRTLSVNGSKAGSDISLTFDAPFSFLTVSTVNPNSSREVSSVASSAPSFSIKDVATSPTSPWISHSNSPMSSLNVH